MREKELTQEEEWSGLSKRERNRRWDRVRGLMRELGLDCIVVFDLQSREQLGKYLTNDVGGGVVVFPAEGELVHLVRNYFNVAGHMESLLRGEEVWASDVRAPAVSGGIIEVLQEKGFDRASIGVVGLDTQQPGAWEGYIPYNTWCNILDNFPNAKFQEVTTDFCKLMLVKSDEELQMVRRAAQIAEMACQAMLDITRPGVGEHEIYVAALSQLLLHGANTSLDVYTTPMILHSGPDNPSWGPPKWLLRGQRPRVIQRGDVICSEIFSTYAGLEAQAQMAIGVEPLDDANKKCAEVARQAYEICLKALEPGKTLAQVAEEAEQVIAESEAYHLSPIIHSVNPINWVGPVAVRVWENMPGMEKYKQLRRKPAHAGAEELIIEPNTVWELEPNASIGKHRVNIGGTVIVTEDGVEELNTLATEMRIVN